MATLLMPLPTIPMAMPMPTDQARTTNAYTPSPDEIEALKAMWPDVEPEVLADLLTFHGNVDKVVDMLLDVDTGGDDELARRIQADQDAEVAKAVHASLQAELQAEEASKREQELPQVAARAINSASIRAKRFLMQRARPSSATTSSTHAVRLLDRPSENGEDYDMAPLQMPEYVPPSVATETQRSSPPAEAFAAPSEPAPALYNARLDRARSANRVRTQSRLNLANKPTEEPSTPNTPTVSCPVAPVAVPEGQLI